jgi:hypothetical protein
MYSKDIIDFAEKLTTSGRKLQIKFNTGISKDFNEFTKLCLAHGIIINKIFDDTFSFNEIIYCVLKNRGPTICSCGNVIINSHKGRRWCSITCRSNDRYYCRGISNIKTKLYNNNEWKTLVESKKVATTVDHYGVCYPMQNIILFEKQQAACFNKDENGHHGFEPHAYPFLKQAYPDIQNGTSFLKTNNIVIKWVGEDKKEHRSYPDFYSEVLNTFIEIKGDYTRSLHNEKLMKCKNALHSMHYGYIICVVKPKKSFSFETYNHEYITERD